jgi:hypothetical protein
MRVSPPLGLRTSRHVEDKSAESDHHKKGYIATLLRLAGMLPNSIPTSAYVSIRQHTSAYVSIRQHTSAYVSIRQLYIYCHSSPTGRYASKHCFSFASFTTSFTSFTTSGTKLQKAIILQEEYNATHLLLAGLLASGMLTDADVC